MLCPFPLEVDQLPVSAFEEAPLSPEPWCQQELGSLGHEDQQTSLLLQIKEEKEKEMWKQGLVEEHGTLNLTNFTQKLVLLTSFFSPLLSTVSHPELQNSEQLQIKGDQIQKGNSQMGEQSLEVDYTQYSESNICVGSYIQYPSKINSAESDKGRPQSYSSTQPLDTRPDSGICVISHLAGEYRHTTEDKIEWKKHASSSLKELNSKRKKPVKRSLPPLSLNIKKSTQSSASENPTGPHCCKACGKTFHYMYTLRTHAQAHTVDKTHICGICGKHLESTENLIQHLQSHKKRNKCGVCGKQFSNYSRLKRHRAFHRPKGINVLSLA